MTDAGRPIRIICTDDHQLVREGIAAVLAREPDFELLAEGVNGRQAVDLYDAHRPDILLLDLQMPVMTGLEALMAIRALHADAKVIVLTTYGGDAQASAAVKAGASGYLLKTSLLKELVEAIRRVHAGDRHLTADIAQQIASHLDREPLTPREIEVLQLVAKGHPNKLVASRLEVSAETVKTHLRNIALKLGARDRTHAVTIALNRGFLVLPDSTLERS